MSADTTREKIHTFCTTLDGGDLATVGELFAPNLTGYMPGTPAPLDRDSFMQGGLPFYTAFPDPRHTAEDVIVEDVLVGGDSAVARLSIRDTHGADFQDMPPTGWVIELGAITYFRFADGKIVEQRVNADFLGLLQQLGTIPAPERAAA